MPSLTSYPAVATSQVKEWIAGEEADIMLEEMNSYRRLLAFQVPAMCSNADPFSAWCRQCRPFPLLGAVQQVPLPLLLNLVKLLPAGMTGAREAAVRSQRLPGFLCQEGGRPLHACCASPKREREDAISIKNTGEPFVL